MLRFFETRIDPFRAHDQIMPPATLVGFYARYCRQVWPWLAALMAVGLIATLIETSILRSVGAIVDILRATTPAHVLEDRGGTFLLMALVVLARPLATIAHDLLTQQTLAPGWTNLIRWQAHRYVLRQSLDYFANDFAGRIASNVVQTGPALRESCVQIIDALWFVTVFATTALVIFAGADWRLALPLAAWICAYASALGWFVPRIRGRSETLAHMRAILTGRVVDSYTNIQTVKLFARVEGEDAHAGEALADHLKAFHQQARLITIMISVGYSSISARRLVWCILAVWICTRVLISLWDIGIDSGLAIRTYTTMSGWVPCGPRSAFSTISASSREGYAYDRAAPWPRRLAEGRIARRDTGRNPLRQRALPLRQGGRRDRQSVVQHRAWGEGRLGRAIRRGQDDDRLLAAANSTTSRARAGAHRQPGRR